MWAEVFRVNLIKDRVISPGGKRIILTLLYSYSFILLLSLIVIFSIYQANSHKIRACKRETARLGQQVSDLGVNLGQIDDFKAEWARLSQEISLINKVMEGRVLWAPKLEALSASLPLEMWIGRLYLEGTSDEGPRTLVLEGLVSIKGGRQLELVEKFITALRKSAVFMKSLAKVELSSAGQTKVGGTEVMTFKLTCPLSK